MRAALIVAALGSMVAAVRVPAVAEARPGGQGPACEAPSARLDKRLAARDARSRAAFEQALARAHLTLTPLAMRELPAEPREPTPLEPGKTIALEGHDPARRVLVMRVSDSRDRGGDEFVADAQGVIHVLVRRPRARSSETHTLCGCGDMGGGAAPQRVVIAYALPDGARVGDPIEVAYDASVTTILWSRTVGGRMCQPPP
jgi:hypothetical protein